MLLLTICIAAILVVLFIALHFTLKIFLIVATLIYSAHIFKIYNLQSKKAITKLSRYNNQWYVNQHPMQFLGDSTVTQYISVLRFKCLVTKQVFTGVIFRDSLQNIPYRQIVMLLRTTEITA